MQSESEPVTFSKTTCKGKKPVELFNLVNNQLFLYCSMKTCICYVNNQRKFSLQKTLQYLQNENPNRWDPYKLMLDCYSSLIKYLEKERESLQQKMKTKSRPILSGFQSQLLQTFRIISSKQCLPQSFLILNKNQPTMIEKMISEECLSSQILKQIETVQINFFDILLKLRKLWATQLKDQIDLLRQGGYRLFESKRGTISGIHGLQPQRQVNQKGVFEKQSLQSITQITDLDSISQSWLIAYCPNLTKLTIHSRNQALPFSYSSSSFPSPTRVGLGFPPLPFGASSNKQKDASFYANPQRIQDFLDNYSSLPNIESLNYIFSHVENQKRNRTLFDKNIEVLTTKFNSLTDLILVEQMKRQQKDPKICLLSDLSINLISKHMMNLQRISIGQNNQSIQYELSTECILSLSLLPKLTSLTLKQVYSTISEHFGSIKTLQALELAYIHKCSNDIFQNISKIENLKILKMHHCFDDKKNPRKQELYSIQSLSKCKKLQKLNIFSIQFARAPLFFSWIEKLNHLTVFMIENNTILNNELSLFGQKTNISILDLAINQRISEEQIKHPMMGINRPPKITTEQILTKLEEPILKKIFSSNNKIIELRLDGRPIKNSGIMIISQQLTSLKKLSIYECGVDNYGMFYVSKLKLLEELYLGSEKALTFNNPRALKAMNNLKSLRYLKMFQTSKSFIQIRDSLRNQFIRINQTNINLKVIGLKSKFLPIDPKINFNYHMIQSRFPKQLFKDEANYQVGKLVNGFGGAGTIYESLNRINYTNEIRISISPF